jgi:transcriptional regulator of acetoin/glycerol metabolism
VEEARRRGYAVNRAERSPHLAGVAIPVFGAGGALAATVGISVPVDSLTVQREAELARLGQATARRIEARLSGAGGVGPAATHRSAPAQPSGSTVSVARQQYHAATER